MILKIYGHVFFRYGLIGFISTIIYFFVMWVGQTLCRINYIAAISVAYVLSTIFHYQMNRHFTFKTAMTPHKKQLSKYLLMWIFNYSLTMLIVSICVSYYLLSPYTAACISSVLVMGFGFILSRLWVFKEGK